ncbi:MAG: ABC transporter permease subunit [Anaerolineaceae bacterium]|nr:ABC transporter permease subunit [Anaerolineaceae bacterium]
MATTTQTSLVARAKTNWQEYRTSKSWQRTLRYLVSYGVLLLGSAFMLFPMLWMISSSLKPSWQIFTQPPIWIPQHWEEIQVGNTNKMLNLWQVTVNGETQKVIQMGLRRYTTVINASLLKNLQTAPADEVSSATATTVGGLTFNVRTWTTNGQTFQVVALAKGDNNTLIVADINDLQSASIRLPLDVVNGGKNTALQVEGKDFRGREVALDSGTIQVIPIGPESQLTVVGTVGTASSATLADPASLQDAGFASVGHTELPLVTIGDQPDKFIILSKETWQPVINEDEFNANAMVVPRVDLTEDKPVTVNNVVVQGATYTPQNGNPVQVAIMLSGTEQSAVIPVDKASSLHLAQLGGLTTTHGAQIKRNPYRVQDGYTLDGTTRSVALVGEPRDMSLVIPESVVNDAFDVTPDQLQRALYPELRFDGYKEALQTKVAETYFPTFFRNSFLLVLLNTIGHVLSCIVVGYAFARLRAPGKNFFFILLLGTMMLPYPVTLVPVYEIFRDLRMVNTLWPLFLRSFFGNAFLIFMLRQFFSTIPRELEEAARIDGAHVGHIIRYIIIPLSKPAIATVIIFTFWWTWNSFLEPFIYLSSPELFPVSVGLNFFKDQYGTIYYDRLMAASVLSMVPMIVIFFFAQRYFIEGIQLTGMKG